MLTEVRNSKTLDICSIRTRWLNKVNTSDTKVSFLDLHLSILDGFVSSIIYDKRDDFDFNIANFPF